MVTCRNIGWDGASIQWNCEGHLDDTVEFGPNTAVRCESYPGGLEGYVVRGSCRLEYTLNFTKAHVSSMHIVYGCVLAIGLLWFYYQSRFLVHRLYVLFMFTLIAMRQFEDGVHVSDCDCFYCLFTLNCYSLKRRAEEMARVKAATSREE